MAGRARGGGVGRAAAVALTCALLTVTQLLSGCNDASVTGGSSSSTTASTTVPAITSQPTSQALTLGQPSTLQVSAIGTAPLTYQWTRDGIAIAGANASSYSLGPAPASDNGAVFAVTVSNSVGSVTSNPVTLTVLIPAMAPSVTTQPASLTVPAGQPATFTITASGSAPLSYQWQRGGSAISGATTASYTLAAASASDNGATFNAIVSNSAGTIASATATLTVTVPTTLAITTTSLPGGMVGQTYSAVLQAGGGTMPYGWSVRGGQLPSGLTLAPGGAISGKPTASGNSSVTIAVTDATGASVSRSFSIVVGNATASPFGHVVVLLEENANYSSVVGSSSMPYLNSLIAKYGLPTQYYSDCHPSICDYEMLTLGQILTDNDNETPATFPISVDNVVREVLAVGKTWKAYAEAMPYAGYLGGDSGLYYVRHVPLAYLTDVQNSPTQRLNLVPFTQFATDLADGQLPNYSFITPNACNDAHNCPLATADAWLKANIAPLLTSSPFKNDGVLIITFDESGNDDTHGGGRISTVIISPAFSKAGYQSAALYQHESVLRLSLEGLGIKVLPGAAGAAPPLWEFFTFPPPQ